MTVASTYTPVQYVGNGVTVAFPFPYTFYASSDLIVTRTQISTGINTVLAITTDYTVSGGNGASGTVTALAAPTSGQRITIERSIPYTQTVNLQENTAFPAETLETALDKSVLMAQQTQSLASRALVIPASDAGVTVVIPNSSTRAGKALFFDGSGNPSVTSNVDTVSAAAAAASASAAAGSAATAVSSAAVATAAANSAIWSDVVFLTSANSPYTVTLANSGDLLSVNTSGGAVVINLPQISTLTLPFNIGIKKTTSDTNAITINRAGTDTIGPAATSKSLTILDQGCTLVADTDPSPDQWAVADFGAPYMAPATVIDLLNTTIIGSSVANVQFINGTGGVVINSTYRYYRLVLSGIKFNTDPTALFIEYRRSDTLAWVAGGGSSSPGIMANGSTSAIAYNGNDVADALRGPICDLGGFIDIFNLSASTNKTCVGMMTALGSAAYNLYVTGNNVNVSQTMDGIRLVADSNFTTGIITLYGYK